MSPEGRRLWPIGEHVVRIGETTTLTYTFDFADSNAEPTPLEGYYILVLSCFGEDQHVFVDFESGAWVAD